MHVNHLSQCLGHNKHLVNVSQYIITMKGVGVEVTFEGWVGFYQVRVGMGKTLAKDGI